MLGITLADAASWAGIVAAVVAVVGLVLYLLHRRRDRIGRETEQAKNRERAEAAERAARQRALESVQVTFTAEGRPPAGNPGRPQVAPLMLYAHGNSPVWVHDVRLTWGAGNESAESEEGDLPCGPWNGDFPLHLQPDNRGLELDWPGARPPQPRPISWYLRVLWSAERTGPTALVMVQGGSTNWQQV